MLCCACLSWVQKVFVAKMVHMRDDIGMWKTCPVVCGVYVHVYVYLKAYLQLYTLPSRVKR